MHLDDRFESYNFIFCNKFSKIRILLSSLKQCFGISYRVNSVKNTFKFIHFIIDTFLIRACEILKILGNRLDEL